MTEQWKPIERVNGWYEVSNLGQIRRVRPGPATHPGRMLKPLRKRSGHLVVDLRCQGKDVSIGVHQVVAEAFIGPRPGGKEVNHLDGNPSNNNVNNLEYATRSENVLHAYRIGLLVAPRGEKCHRSKLTTAQIMVVRNCQNVPLPTIAKAFGVTKGAIQSIIQMRSWRHLGVTVQ